MKNITSILLLVLFNCCNLNNTNTNRLVKPDKFQLIFSNESPYPIVDISTFSSNFYGLPHANLEQRTIGHILMPHEVDTLFFDAFNRRAFSIHALFVVGNDTVMRKPFPRDDPGDHTLNRGIIKFNLYDSEKDSFLQYTREIIE